MQAERKVAASRRISRQAQPWIAATSRSAREVAANPWLMLASRRNFASTPAMERRDISVGSGVRVDATSRSAWEIASTRNFTSLSSSQVGKESRRRWVARSDRERAGFPAGRARVPAFSGRKSRSPRRETTRNLRPGKATNSN